MRADAAAFAAHNQAATKEPFYVFAVSWDSANTDITYLTSHANADAPAGADIVAGVVEGFNGTSQELDPIDALASIGDLTFTAIDKASALTNKINTKLVAGDGLREKRVQVWVGYKGLAWSDYALVQTQLVEEIRFMNGLYTFKCSDIQRAQRKDIFDLAETNITSTINIGAIEDVTTTNPVSIKSPGHGRVTNDKITIRFVNGTTQVNDNEYTLTKVDDDNFTIGVDGTSFGAYTGGGFWGDSTISVVSTAEFETYQHGASYSDAPSATVGYFRVKDTVYRYTGKTSTTFTGVLHALFNTKPVKQDIGTVTENDRKPKVEEFVYLEEPAVQLAYKVQTGSYGGISLPSKWHLGISTSYIATSKFENIGDDLWDTSDVTAGFIVRFEGLKKQDGKRFLEKEIYRLLGVFSPVLNNGQLSLRRMSNILNDAPYVKVLDVSNVISYSELVHDMQALHNNFRINWNWNWLKDEFTRHDALIDTDSIAVHGKAPQFEMNFKGLNGSSHTDMTVALRRDSARDRYTGPPLRLTLTCKHHLNTLEPGDVVRVTLPNVRDFSNNTTGVDRSFEVQKASIDWITGDVVLKLFGTSRKPGSISTTSLSTVLSDAFYTGTGTQLSTVLTMSGNNVTANGTLTGNTDMNAAGAIYYHDSDLTINAGVDVTIVNNVQLRVKGHLTINGSIDGSAQGLAGATAPTPTAGVAGFLDKTLGSSGFIGSPISGGGLATLLMVAPPNDDSTTHEGYLTEGTHSAVPNAELVYNGTTLAGIPSDMRGTSGASGHVTQAYTYSAGALIIHAKGGNGGASGAGLCIINRGLSFGVNGNIDLSGADGSVGNSVTTRNGNILYAGSGAGGAPGALLTIIDGNFSEPDIESGFTANMGRTPVQGRPVTGAIQSLWVGGLISAAGSNYFTNRVPITAADAPACSNYIANGNSTVSLAKSAYRVQYVPENLTAKADVGDQAGLPVFNTITSTDKPNFSDNIISAISVSVTPPSDENYLEARIYYKLSTQTAWSLLGSVSGSDVITLEVLKNGLTYNFKAHSVSTALIESDDFTTASFTVGTDIGEKAEFRVSNWIERAPAVPVNNPLLSVYWANDLYLAGGLDFSSYCLLLTSDDGINWVRRVNPKSGHIISFVYAVSKYVAVGNDSDSAITKCWSYDGATYNDETNDINNGTANDVTLYADVNDALYYGSNEEFTNIVIFMGTTGSGGAVAYEYWNGSSWAALSGVTDTTSAYTVNNIGDDVYWDRPANWATTSVNGVTLYWVRARVTTALTGSPLITYAELRFDPYIITSTDGATWSEQNNPGTGTLEDIIYANSKFVAVGAHLGLSVVGASIYTSTDAITWVEQSHPLTSSGDILHGLVYGGGIFVAVGTADGVDANILTSTDGTTWLERSNPRNSTLYAVAYGNIAGEDVYVAVGVSNGTDAYIARSTDGVNWTAISNPKNVYLEDIIYSNGIFIAVGGTDGVDAYMLTSRDGLTWKERRNPQKNTLYSVTGGGDAFCAVGYPDGTNPYMITSLYTD